MRRRWAPFVALELATVLAGVANGITMVAFPWLVLEVTGSPAAAGTIAAITAVPMVVASFFAGTIVDRFGRRFCSIVSDLLSLASVLLVPAAAALDRLDVAVLAVVAVLGAVFDPTGITAREAMLPGAARAAALPLERVNGIHEALWNVAFVIGPGVGGLLIGLVGATATFWATAVAFALSALAIVLVPIPGGERPEQQRDGPSLAGATVEGLRFLWHDPLLRTLALFYTVLVAAWMPIQSVVLPAWFQSRDEPEALGTVLVVSSIGAIFGALAYAAIGHRTERRARLFVVAAVLMSLPVALLALLPPLWAVVVLMGISGLFWGPVNPMVNLAIQRRTPPELLGRINGLVGSVAFAAAPLGFLVAGWSYEAAGPAITLGLFGGLLVLASLGLALVPGIRLLDRLPAQPPTGAQVGR